jgi:hypothetical protein
MVALSILCMAGIDFRLIITHHPQPAGHTSSPKHLGNVDCPVEPAVIIFLA